MVHNTFDAVEEEGQLNQNRIQTRSWNIHVLITAPAFSCFMGGKLETV